MANEFMLVGVGRIYRIRPSLILSRVNRSLRPISQSWSWLSGMIVTDRGSIRSDAVKVRRANDQQSWAGLRPEMVRRHISRRHGL